MAVIAPFIARRAATVPAHRRRRRTRAPPLTQININLHLLAEIGLGGKGASGRPARSWLIRLQVLVCGHRLMTVETRRRRTGRKIGPDGGPESGAGGRTGLRSGAGAAAARYTPANDSKRERQIFVR